MYKKPLIVSLISLLMLAGVALANTRLAMNAQQLVAGEVTKTMDNEVTVKMDSGEKMFPLNSTADKPALLERGDVVVVDEKTKEVWKVDENVVMNETDAGNSHAVLAKVITSSPEKMVIRPTGGTTSLVIQPHLERVDTPIPEANQHVVVVYRVQEVGGGQNDLIAQGFVEVPKHLSKSLSSMGSMK